MDTNYDNLKFTPEALRQLSRDVEKIRFQILYEMDDGGADSVSEQFFLLALNALEEAQRHLSLASVFQSKGYRVIPERPSGVT